MTAKPQFNWLLLAALLGMVVFWLVVYWLAGWKGVYTAAIALALLDLAIAIRERII